MIKTIAKERNSDAELRNATSELLLELVPGLHDIDSKRFFDLSSDIHCVAGLDGYAKKINRAATQLFGYTERELLTRPFIEFVIEEEQEQTMKRLCQAMAGDVPVHFESRMRCKDGSIKWISWRSFVVREEELIFTIGRDVTEEKNVEPLLKEQALSLKEFLNSKIDGLQYARLLQEAIFHDPDTLNRMFDESFVFHASKDIIGGDFYWFDKIGDKAFVGCADCTGHGVPGAMLSVLATSKLNELIASSELPPAKILDKLNTIIYTALGKKYGDKKMNDGLDIALYSVDMETKLLHYSGANNPLYIVRDGELTELHADKKSIGTDLDITPFCDLHFQLRTGDMLYIFSDGYADQFGGGKNKKFTRKQFKDLLLSIAHHNASKQKEILSESLKCWMGDNEQTDDICVVGVRIN